MARTSEESSLLVNGYQSYWVSQIEAAQRAKKPFDDVGELCYSFYKKSSGFMWEPKFKKKYLERVDSPKFAVTLQKAFEFVAVIGPYLMWQNPNRRVLPLELPDYPPELFVNEQPGSQQIYEMLAQQHQKENMQREWRAKLMGSYLNYSSREQPHGLETHCQWAVVDAMIKGRGCLWPVAYSFPGDTRRLTRLEYASVDNLLIDPDCRDPELRTAKWIARKHVTPYWELETRFGLKKDSLKGKGSSETNSHRISDTRRRGRRRREVNSETGDLITWYEVFSRLGVGSRDTRFKEITGHESSLHKGFEDVTGGFAYMAISPTVEFPLNLPTSKIRRSKEEVFESLMWPCPSYVDNLFPVALLDFYPDTNSAWPIAPLGPATGELIAMNIILSAFLENAYENRKSIVAIAEHAVVEFEAAMKSNRSTEYVKLKNEINQSVSEVVQILNRPEMNMDPLRALEYLGDSFARRTGLTDFQFAVTTTQSRSAADIAAKEEKSSIRPDKMSKDVAKWVSHASRLEAFLAGIEVSGEDIQGRLGTMGATLWDVLISDNDPITIAREMTITVEASDIRKPNKARDAQNMQTAAGFVMPALQTYASLTGDSEPLNSFLASFGESIEMSTKDWKMGPWAPQPDPMQQQIAQQSAQLQMEEQTAEIEKTQAETQKILFEMSQPNDEMEQAGKVQQLLFDREKFAIDQEQKAIEQERKQQQHEQKLTQDQIDFMQKQAQSDFQFRQKMAQFNQESAIRKARKAAGGV